jgi:hypothetical protein
MEVYMRHKVFISYSHQDANWLKRLRIHLKPLERENNINVWDDTRIIPGSNWKDEIRKAIESTKVAVLLVSADFLASEFIATDELPPLLKAAEEDGAVILPFILSPSRFLNNESLAQFQAVNDPSKPLIGLSKVNQEKLLLDLTEDIEVSLGQSSAKPHNVRDRATIASQSLSQTMAMVFVDIMRLLYVASGNVIRHANIESYSEFISILDCHLQDLYARMAGFSLELDAELRERIFQLRSNLSWMLDQLRLGPDMGSKSIEYFANVQKISNRLDGFCLTTIGEQYNHVVENVQGKIERALMQKHFALNSMSLDDLWCLRLEVQDQLLEEGRKSGQAMIFTIADDMDQVFATEYFVLDHILLSRSDRQQPI